MALNKPLKNRYNQNKNYTLNLRSKRVERKKLDREQIQTQLAELNDWQVAESKLLKRFNFNNFAEALDFINRVGDIAERHDHHPDITFGWGYAEINLTTHDAGGLTSRDFAVAAQIDAIGG
jgi:4a-hydroxytetrahydrobiopterin dehydratase